jgi:hypothetical protein
LRVIEAVTAISALLVTSALQPQLDHAVTRTWLLDRELSGAWLVVSVYYLAFQYLLFSAIAFALAEASWGLNRKRVATLTNLGAFLVHSAAVIIIVFGGKFGAFWGAWGAVAIVDWLVPALLVSRLEGWLVRNERKAG